MEGAKSALDAIDQLDYDGRTLSCKIVPPRDAIAKGKATKVKPDGPVKKKAEAGAEVSEAGGAEEPAKKKKKAPAKVVAF